MASILSNRSKLTNSFYVVCCVLILMLQNLRFTLQVNVMKNTRVVTLADIWHQILCPSDLQYIRFNPQRTEAVFSCVWFSVYFIFVPISSVVHCGNDIEVRAKLCIVLLGFNRANCHINKKDKTFLKSFIIGWKCLCFYQKSET